MFNSLNVCQVLGYTIDELKQDPDLWVRRIHPDDRARISEAARKASLETDLTVQLLCSGEDRLIHTLLTLAGCDSRCNGRYALPKVSQAVIAEMVGTTRSRVNFFMGKFKKHGFLQKQGDLLQVIPSNLAFLRADSRAL